MMWYNIPNAFVSSRLKIEHIRLMIYGTYSSSKLIKTICSRLGHPINIIIEFERKK